MLWMKFHPSLIISNITFAIIDIFIISFIFYKFYQILNQTRAVQAIRGLLIFGSFYLISKIFSLQAFSWILDQIAAFAVIGIIIVFQPEIRRILTKVGQSNWMSHLIKKDPEVLNEIIKAVQNFSIISRGALIVFERKTGLKTYIESGVAIEGKVTASLLMTIFHDKTALHDGAVIIRNNTVAAAGCMLPLSNSTEIDQKYGTRHRAALGLTEETDAVVVVVSEETSKIAVAVDGKLYTNYSIELLTIELNKLLDYNQEDLEDSSNET